MEIKKFEEAADIVKKIKAINPEARVEFYDDKYLRAYIPLKE